MSLNYKKNSIVDRRLLILLFMISFTIFVFTNDAHRYTIDEDIAQRLTKRIVTMTPDPLYKEGESHVGFEFEFVPPGPLCKNAILCSGVYLGHTLTQVPILALNHYFDLINSETVTWTNDDFNDPHYVFWRNTIDPDFTFMELFYGPIFSSLSVITFFSICQKTPYRKSTSIILSLLFALTTSVWAYSQTSFNLVSVSFFVLLGIFFFFKFLKENSSKNLIFSGLTLGFAFMVRHDAIIAIGVTLAFVIFYVIKKNHKLRTISHFVISAAILILIYRLIDYFRFETYAIAGGSWVPTNNFPFQIGLVGLLFSPGVGIFVFYPVLILSIIGFFDFYKKNNIETYFLIGLIIAYLTFYATIPNWHGMNAWADRYMLTIIPLFLIPLGATLENRNNKIWVVVLVLAGIGFLSNIVYVIQDENWFVWGTWGSSSGLISLGAGLNIHPAAMWTFEYSQLTHSILTAFTNLQPDIYLLKLFGTSVYLVLLLGVLIPLGYLIIRILQTDSRYEYLKQKY